MKLVICGAGIIGFNLARYLASEGHEINLVEKDEQIAFRAAEKLDVRVITGSATDPAVLEEAGVAGADLVIAVTDSDVYNLSICSLSAAIGARKRIARVRDVRLNETIQKFGPARFFIDEIINPDEVAAQAIVKVIKAPGSLEVVDFAEGRILLRSFELPEDSPLAGVKLVELREQDFPWPFLVVAISRNGEVIIPRGEDTFRPHDRIYVLLPKPSLAEFLTFVHPAARVARRVVIFGATSTGESVARNLSKFVKEVILLEEDRALAEEVAGRLDGVRVMHGSASEVDILRECGTEKAGAFIAVSGSDHFNLISAVLAKKVGAGKAIIVAHQPDYLAIVGAMDIDVVINPRLLATDQILRLVRGGSIHHMARLPDVNAEILEMMPEPDSAVTSDTLRKVNFPPDAIVGAVFRESGIILADGNTRLNPGERVIVFSREEAVPRLQKLFTRRRFLH